MMYVILIGVIIIGIAMFLERKYNMEIPERSDNQLEAERHMFSDIQRDTRMF